MSEHESEWSTWLAAALSVGGRLCKSSAEFDDACSHVASLLSDSAALLDRGSHATASFLAITAIEETAKVHIGNYRRRSDASFEKRDLLLNHKAKHRLALGPTVPIGARLINAIGADRTNQLIEAGFTGGFVRLRESALYIERPEGLLAIPSKAISPKEARELLLLAIEVFDDALVGYTSHTHLPAETTDRLFNRITIELQELSDAAQGNPAAAD